MSQEQKKGRDVECKDPGYKGSETGTCSYELFCRAPQLAKRSFGLSDPAVISAINAQIGESGEIILA